MATPTPQTTMRSELNWHITETMERDQAQSRRLHEPEYRWSTTDPMTGSKVEDVKTHFSIVDGNLTIYFETEATCEAYQSFPLNHPNLHLPFPATDDDDRGG